MTEKYITEKSPGHTYAVQPDIVKIALPAGVYNAAQR